MDEAWPPSSGEAIHTSTFLGHPVGCAMALAQIEEIKKEKLVEQSVARGKFLMCQLQKQIRSSKFQIEIRGLGLMAGLELKNQNGSPATKTSLQLIKEMLHRGFILLPEGEHANVISFTPPLTISERDLANTVKSLAKLLAEYGSK